jgi:hypothetical protein
MMKKLIRTRASNTFYGEREYWLINDRFELIIESDSLYCTFFIDDKMDKISCLELIPRIVKDLDLFKDADVVLMPGIDSCAISTSKKSRRDEIFKLIENYLLNPDNFSDLEKKGISRL